MDYTYLGFDIRSNKTNITMSVNFHYLIICGFKSSSKKILLKLLSAVKGNSVELKGVLRKAKISFFLILSLLIE